jgi:hypothetical protein
LASILIAATFSLLYSEAVSQNGRSLFTFLLILLGALVTSIHWVTRPHLFTMLFLAIWLIWMERLYRGISVNPWAFPMLMLLWANIHAEFIAGFLVVLAYLAGWAWQSLLNRSRAQLKTGKNLLVVAASSLVASALNPVGLRTWDIVFSYLNNRYLLSRIAETRPPDFTRSEYWPLIALLGISIFLFAKNRNKFTSAHFFLMTGFGIMSLLSARNAHLAGIVLPFVLSLGLMGSSGFQAIETIESTISKMESRNNKSGWIVAITILIGALLIGRPMRNVNRFEPAIFPVDAVSWLEAHPQTGRMFNAFDWGGYILFHLWPEQKAFIESQTDVTGEATREYEKVITLQEGWQEVFKQYNITWAIIPPQWPLTKELIALGWQTAYQDQTAVILVEK